jgi:hypothetical protein
MIKCQQTLNWKGCEKKWHYSGICFSKQKNHKNVGQDSHILDQISIKHVPQQGRSIPAWVKLCHDM